MFKKYMVGRKNIDISLLWAVIPSTLRTTDLEHYELLTKVIGNRTLQNRTNDLTLRKKLVSEKDQKEIMMKMSRHRRNERKAIKKFYDFF